MGSHQPRVKTIPRTFLNYTHAVLSIIIIIVLNNYCYAFVPWRVGTVHYSSASALREIRSPDNGINDVNYTRKLYRKMMIGEWGTEGEGFVTIIFRGSFSFILFPSSMPRGKKKPNKQTVLATKEKSNLVIVANRIEYLGRLKEFFPRQSRLIGREM